jgi:uncharacterized protein
LTRLNVDLPPGGIVDATFALAALKVCRDDEIFDTEFCVSRDRIKSISASIPNSQTGGRSALRGPSFDCSKGRGANETTICKSARLSGLDRQLARIYASLRSRLDQASAIQVRDEQRAWLQQRLKCRSSETCLISVYETRIAELQNYQ